LSSETVISVTGERIVNGWKALSVAGAEASFLCRGGGMVVFRAKRHREKRNGNASSDWISTPKTSFGIKPARGLRSLIIQAEDDEGDVTEMARIVDHLGLTTEQRKAVGRNTWIEFVNDLTGQAFVAAIDRFLQVQPADLVWINPYSSYPGDDIKDDKANTAFLRNGLNPILTRHRCTAVVIHHTPKTNHRGDTSDWKPSDWQYGGAGAAVLTNWARAGCRLGACKRLCQ
jgi:hypothetical protein